MNRVIVKHIPPTTLLGRRSRSRWELVEDLKVGIYTVPKGFITDGVTIPYWLFLIAKRTGTMFEPAILHDYLLSKLSSTESRKEADKVFRKAGYLYISCKRKLLKR